METVVIKNKSINKDRYKKLLVAMIDKNLSQKDIAKMLGCSEMFVCYLLWGQRKSKRKEQKLYEILGVESKELSA
ncbi:MAG: hypothetical protein JXB50_16975 [Spirochaetes bacterium]|nr:hypothetical protein [Spirochaetota bacterium]